MEKRITGIAVSPGIAIGKVYLFEKKEVEINKCPCKNPEEEKAKLIEGRNKTKEQLQKIRENYRKKSFRGKSRNI